MRGEGLGCRGVLGVYRVPDVRPVVHGKLRRRGQPQRDDELQRAMPCPTDAACCGCRMHQPMATGLGGLQSTLACLPPQQAPGSDERPKPKQTNKQAYIQTNAEAACGWSFRGAPGTAACTSREGAPAARASAFGKRRRSWPMSARACARRGRASERSHHLLAWLREAVRVRRGTGREEVAVLRRSVY